LLKLLPGIVGAVVIYAYNFNGFVGLCKGRMDAFFDVIFNVEGGYYDGDEHLTSISLLSIYVLLENITFPCQ